MTLRLDVLLSGKGIIDLKSDKTHQKKERSPMLPDKQQKAYNDFYNATLDNGLFDAKTTRLIHLAASMAIGCYP
jgi:hypothetical protein